VFCSKVLPQAVAALCLLLSMDLGILTLESRSGELGCQDFFRAEVLIQAVRCENRELRKR
jgi:hypothetical protein